MKLATQVMLILHCRVKLQGVQIYSADFVMNAHHPVTAAIFCTSWGSSEFRGGFRIRKVRLLLVSVLSWRLQLS